MSRKPFEAEMFIFPSPRIPRFVQAVELRPCGTSEHVFESINNWLLKRFGGKRVFVQTECGEYYTHNDNFRWLVSIYSSRVTVQELESHPDIRVLRYNPILFNNRKVGNHE